MSGLIDAEEFRKQFFELETEFRPCQIDAVFDCLHNSEILDVDKKERNMTIEKLWKAEELSDRIESLCKKLNALREMQNKASDCAKNSELLVSVGTRSNMSSMFIDTDAVMLMLKEAEAWYTEKKRDVEDEFAKL